MARHNVCTNKRVWLIDEALVSDLGSHTPWTSPQPSFHMCNAVLVEYAIGSVHTKCFQWNCLSYFSLYPDRNNWRNQSILLEETRGLADQIGGWWQDAKKHQLKCKVLHPQLSQPVKIATPLETKCSSRPCRNVSLCLCKLWSCPNTNFLLFLLQGQLYFYFEKQFLGKRVD